jgi:hypothetical protein
MKINNKRLILFILSILALCQQGVLGDDIIVKGADTMWNLMLDSATYVEPIVGEPGVMVTRYADAFAYFPLEESTGIDYLVGEPGVIVTKYTDIILHLDLMKPPFNFTTKIMLFPLWEIGR